jgi:glutamate carboxypeptidase
MLLSLRHLAIAAAAAVVCNAAVAAGADTGLLDAARSAQPAVVQSLKDMVSIESGSANIEGLDRMADYTSKRLQALGARWSVCRQARARARSSRRR